MSGRVLSGLKGGGTKRGNTHALRPGTATPPSGGAGRGRGELERRRAASQQGHDHADVHNDQKDGEGLLEL